MSALTQYIDLYRQHGDIVDANSGGALNSMRGDALRALENMALPREGSETYETTDSRSVVS